MDASDVEAANATAPPRAGPASRIARSNSCTASVEPRAGARVDLRVGLETVLVQVPGGPLARAQREVPLEERAVEQEATELVVAHRSADRAIAARRSNLSEPGSSTTDDPSAYAATARSREARPLKNVRYAPDRERGHESEPEQPSHSPLPQRPSPHAGASASPARRSAEARPGGRARRGRRSGPARSPRRSSAHPLGGRRERRRRARPRPAYPGVTSSRSNAAARSPRAAVARGPASSPPEWQRARSRPRARRPRVGLATRAVESASA